MGYYRKPKTRQEMRVNQKGAKGGGRAKRAPSHLPHTWSDIPKGDRKDRSWKKFRRSKHRAINAISLT